MSMIQNIFNKISKSNILEPDELEHLRIKLGIEEVVCAENKCIEFEEKIVEKFDEDKNNYLMEASEEKKESKLEQDKLEQSKLELKSKNNISMNTSFKRKTKTEAVTPQTKCNVFGFDGCSLLSAKNLLVKYDEPVDVEKVFSIASKKKAECSYHGRGIFSFHREEKLQIKSDKHFRIGDKVPIIRSFLWSEIIEKRNKVDFLEDGYALINFFLFRSDESKEKLVERLKIALLNTRILFYSEFTLSCLVFSFIYHWGVRNKWMNLKIFSLDGKMELYKLDIRRKTCFRCDCIIVYLDKMFVLEYKFVHNRPQNMGTVGLECIEEKGYINKSTEFLFVNYPEEMDGISEVFGVGLGFSDYGSDINVGIEFKSYGKPTRPTNLQKQVEFLSSLRSLKKFEEDDGEDIGKYGGFPSYGKDINISYFK